MYRVLDIRAGVWRTTSIERGELLSEQLRVVRHGRTVRAQGEVNLSPHRIQQPRAQEGTCRITDREKSAEAGCAIDADDPASQVDERTLDIRIHEVGRSAGAGGAPSRIIEDPPPCGNRRANRETRRVNGG